MLQYLRENENDITKLARWFDVRIRQDGKKKKKKKEQENNNNKEKEKKEGDAVFV